MKVWGAVVSQPFVHGDFGGTHYFTLPWMKNVVLVVSSSFMKFWFRHMWIICTCKNALFFIPFNDFCYIFHTTYWFTCDFCRKGALLCKLHAIHLTHVYPINTTHVTRTLFRGFSKTLAEAAIFIFPVKVQWYGSFKSQHLNSLI